MSVAWVLNLDAEFELEKGSTYVATQAVTARVKRMREVVRSSFCSEGDVLLDEEAAPSADLRAYRGLSWCPTPSALQRLAEAGATVPSAPSPEVLRRVNHRAFCAALGQMLDGARFVYRLDELQKHLLHDTPSGRWRLKSALGFSGRGHRSIAVGKLDDRHDRIWVEAAMRRGDGLQLEPWVEREADFVIHAYLAPGGELSLGFPSRQCCDEHGAWLETTRVQADELGSDEVRALEDAAREAAVGLRQAGYFGPFGIDAYRYREGTSRRFNPRSEINARYTMGWMVGMGDSRPDLAAA